MWVNLISNNKYRLHLFFKKDDCVISWSSENFSSRERGEKSHCQKFGKLSVRDTKVNQQVFFTFFSYAISSKLPRCIKLMPKNIIHWCKKIYILQGIFFLNIEKKMIHETCSNVICAFHVIFEYIYIWILRRLF